MTSITAAASPDATALRRALLRLVVVVAVLMLVAGVPRGATPLAPGASVELALRDAIASYRAEHDGLLPVAHTWDELLDQLRRPTDLAGRPGGSLGPYLSAEWLRKADTGDARGRVVDSLPAATDGPAAPDGVGDLLWCRTTGELRRAR